MEISDSGSYGQHSHRQFAGLTKYGGSRNPPSDDAESYPTDATHGVFAKVLFLLFFCVSIRVIISILLFFMTY